MRSSIILLFLCAVLLSCSTTPEEKKPNIIYILADDLGYGDVGAYGQKLIQTPNIDALAKNGMKFTRHYSGAPVCAPSRYALLTGLHMGHSFIRGNDEWQERGAVWDFAAMLADSTLEGQRPIPDSTLTMGEVMQQAGYKTALIGKWGLGAPASESTPNTQLFDYFCGYNCQRQAHNLYPTHIWENESRIYLSNAFMAPGEKLATGSDTLAESSFDKFYQADYAPGVMHEKALGFLRENKDNPFFMYYASPLPHLPLQVPKEYVEKYHAIFGDEQPYLGNLGYFPHRYPRAAYAGMISYLDDQVGELVATLKELGIYENTLIIFTSDNGPTYTAGVDFEYFNSTGPYTNGYGRNKGFVYEGGIRVPMIASWEGKIKPGTTTDLASAFYDVMPTFCELVGIAAPAKTDGISFLPTLLGRGNQAKHEFLYWELLEYTGQQAVQMGDWKGIRKGMFEGNLEVELYNLKSDPQEQNNVAAENPEVVAQIEAIMKREHEPAATEKFKFEALGEK
ncbi:MAG: arylsulfatase [Imperialibacter sp.]|uniref:arylsulfatase n=1 Tax=Imperialibacter sp. TaxID=2038411 RepID=UPI0032EC3BE1